MRIVANAIAPGTNEADKTKYKNTYKKHSLNIIGFHCTLVHKVIKAYRVGVKYTISHQCIH